MINQEMPLTKPVAQQESTRSYFLAQTLESTKTIPVVSANLPLDTTVVEEIVEPVEGDNGAVTEDEGGEDSDESDLAAASIAAESTVVGSFGHRGITYAVEPGGESVAIVAADINKLPADVPEAQTIVLPSAVSADGIHNYAVSRIADNAFSSLKAPDASLGTPIYDEGAAEAADVAEITAITIPASITTIDDDAFTGFDTLEYLIVSADNPNYSMYDGALYNADQTCLLLIPEGRTGAVRISSETTEAKVETFSHHADLSLLVDADSAAFTSENGFDNVDVTIVSPEDDAADQREPLAAAYDVDATVDVGSAVNVLALLNLDQREDAPVAVAASGGSLLGEGMLQLDEPGATEVVAVVNQPDMLAYYALHVNVEGETLAAAAEATPLNIATAASYNNDIATHAADPAFVHNAENCALGGGDLVPAKDGHYYGWTCPEYKNYVAHEYSSTPGTPGYVWVPEGIKPSAHISKQAVEAGEYYLIAGGKFENKGTATNSGGLFPTSQVRNDNDGKDACAWWEITASNPKATLGTLRIHCDYGTTIINTENNFAKNAGAPYYQHYLNDPGDKSPLNGWRNASDFTKIRDVVFDHVDAEDCSTWFGTAVGEKALATNIETVTFLGNTAPPSVRSMESFLCFATKFYSFSENFTLIGLNELIDVRWMFWGCYKLASFPMQFNFPEQLVSAWGWAEAALSLGSLPDGFRTTEGLKPVDDMSPSGASMLYMFGLNKTSILKDSAGLTSGQILSNANKLIDDKRVWYYGGNDEPTLDYLVNGKGHGVDHVLIRSPHVTWDARGGTFSYSSTSSPTGSSYYPLAFNCSYIEPLYEVNDATVTSNKKNTVKVPQSPKKDDLHFIGWYVKVPVGETPDQMTKNEKNCVYRWERLPERWGSGFDHNGELMTAPDETTFIYALYAEDEFVSNISFDLNTGLGTAPETIKDQTIDVAMRQSHVDVASFDKPGYIFDGFWSDKVGGKQYYDKYGDAVPNVRWTERAQDVTNPEVTLYAHWKYKVYLDPNTYNTDGELVLNSTTSTIVDGNWTQNSGAEFELTPYLLDTQTGLLAEGNVKQEPVQVESAEGTQPVRITRYYIEATSGAPLNLPKVKNRTGYSDTFAWGLTPGDYGTATDIVAAESAEGYLANDTGLAKKYADLVASDPNYDPKSDQSITLYADWSGKAKSYWVQLQPNYSTNKAPIDTFNAGANAVQYKQVVYDQPIDMAGLQKPVDNTTLKNDVTGVYEPRNLRLTGFRTQPNSVRTDDGREYVRVANDALTNETADSTAANLQTIKFRETNDGKTGAVTTTATVPGGGTQTVVVLYAKYLNPEVTVNVDLQSGFLNDPTVSPSFTVVTNDPVPELADGVNDVPTRDGFMFAGYWSTKYTEGAGTYETIDGRKVETKQYYKTNSDGSAMVPVPDASDAAKATAWTSYSTTDTLYAHWKFKIYLNTNEWYLGATEAGNQAQFANAGNLLTDAHGTYILATVGEPIQLPEVIGRTGYKDDRSVAKNAWGVVCGKYGAATGLVSRESIGTLVTANTSDGDLDLAAGKSLDLTNAEAKSAWGADLFTASAKDATFPQPEREPKRRLEDGTMEDNPEYQSITLYLDWSKRAKTYTVQLQATYDDIQNKVAYDAQDGYTKQITAQYDAPLLKQVGDSVVTTVGDQPVIAPIYKKTPKNGYTVYDDQVFSGYYDAILDGTEYIGANVENDGTNITSQMTPALTGSAAAYVPFRFDENNKTLYARWSMPVCQVTFDMNDGLIDQDGEELDKVKKAFTIAAGDSLPRFGSTQIDAYGNTDTGFLATQPYYRVNSQTGSDYVFAGYYDAPAGGTCYYTADCQPVPGRKWDKYGNVTLYARWTYTVQLDLKDSDRNAKVDYEDSLQVLGGGSALNTNANGKLVTTVIYGGDATIPATKAAVTRLRGETGSGSAQPKQPTGYTFNGWYDAQTGGAQKGGPNADLVLSVTNKELLKPTNGVAKLYAGWDPVSYLVQFDYTSNNAFSKAENFRAGSNGYPIYGLENTPVQFDGVLLSATDPVPAPQLMGWTFQGYWTKPQKADDVNDRGDKGMQYVEPLEGDATQMVGVDGVRWSETAASSNGTITLYAHYTRIPYQLHFDKNAGSDRVTFESDGSIVNDLDSINAYFDMELSKASPSHARTLKRAGYKFAGWATCENYAAYQKLPTEAAKAEALYYTADGAAVANKRYRTEGDLTLNALWEPIAYTLTWDASYPAEEGSTSVKWATTQQNYGDPLVLPKDENGNDPAFTGYKFLGWYNGENDDATKLIAGDPYKIASTSSSGATYYAHWEIVPYSFTLLPGAHGSYDADQGFDAQVDPTTGWYTRTYTVESEPGDFLEPNAIAGWLFNGWEELSEGYEPTSNHYGPTELSRLGALTADNLETQPEVYDGKYFRAKWKTEGYTLTLNANGATLPSPWETVTDIDVQSEIDLPVVSKAGWTFRGWYAEGVNPDDPGATAVTHVRGATESLVYVAQFSANKYKLRFVQGTSDATKNIEVAESIPVTVQSTGVTAPLATRYDVFATEAAAAGKNACSVFDCYTIRARDGRVYSYRAGDAIPVQTLVNRVNSTASGETGIDGVFTLVANWTSAYNVAVPLKVEISFDRERVAESMVVGEHYMEIKSTSSSNAIEVAQLMVEPVATVGTMLGTEDAFRGDGDANTDLAGFATLTLTAGNKEANPTVRLPLSAVKDSMKVSAVNDQSTDPAVTKSLGDAGFRLGGVDAGAVRKLPLHFNLEFADGFDAKRLTAFDAIRDYRVTDTDGTTKLVGYPIARIYYVLQLA